MEVIYGLLPAMLLLGFAAVIVFFWALRSGQYDDLEGEGQRILMDDLPGVDLRLVDVDQEGTKDESGNSTVVAQERKQ